MKKTYNKPELSIYSVPAYCETPDVITGSTQGGSNALAKEREYEEDNEAFNVTDGEGMASYGDLW